MVSIRSLHTEVAGKDSRTEILEEVQPSYLEQGPDLGFDPTPSKSQGKISSTMTAAGIIRAVQVTGDAGSITVAVQQ